MTVNRMINTHNRRLHMITSFMNGFITEVIS